MLQSYCWWSKPSSRYTCQLRSKFWDRLLMLNLQMYFTKLIFFSFLMTDFQEEGKSISMHGQFSMLLAGTKMSSLSSQRMHMHRIAFIYYSSLNLFPPPGYEFEVATGLALVTEMKTDRRCDHFLLWKGSPCSVKFQVLQSFIWTMTCHNYYLWNRCEKSKTFHLWIINKFECFARDSTFTRNTPEYEIELLRPASPIGPEGHLFDSARRRAQFSFLWTSLWTLLWSIALEYETFYLFIQGSSEKIGTLMKWNCRYLILTMLNLPVLGIFNRKTTYSQCILHITAPMSSVGSRNSTELRYRAWNILQPVLVFFIEIHLCTAFAQIPVEISRFEIIPDSLSLSLSLSRFVSNSPRVILS